MKEKLLSLQCCGESIEKVFTLYYFAKLSAPRFYNNYEVILLYGHNLPKKNKNLKVHGSVGFYQSYYNNSPYFPNCSKNHFVSNKDYFLSLLVKQSFLTSRAARKLEQNTKRYLKYIENLPVGYIYPEFIERLTRNSCELLKINHIMPLYLEKNYMSVINLIDKEHYRYNIYALDFLGRIGKYDIPIDRSRKLIHLYSELQKAPVLSGNSAFLLRQINSRISNRTVIGYREHKRNIRPNRDFALVHLLQNKKTIIEPEITGFNLFFKKYLNESPNEKLSDEELANVVFSKAFLQFVTDNHSKLDLK